MKPLEIAKLSSKVVSLWIDHASGKNCTTCQFNKVDERGRCQKGRRKICVKNVCQEWKSNE